MVSDASIRFFEAQFEQQLREADLRLNPFEQAALPYLHGRVLEYGCGLGNLAVAAACRGCSVLALDASHAAIEHLGQVARNSSLNIEAGEADLRTYELRGEFDSVVAIGLLMFFDCPTAFAPPSSGLGRPLMSNVRAQRSSDEESHRSRRGRGYVRNVGARRRRRPPVGQVARSDESAHACQHARPSIGGQ